MKSEGEAGRERARRGRALLERAVLIGPLPFFLVFFYLIPFVGIVSWSVTLPEPGIGNYARLFSDLPALNVILRTLRICALTTLISLLIGYLLAYGWVFGSTTVQWLVELGVLIPFWISVLVRTFGWLAILGREGIANASLISAGLIDSPLALVRNEIGVVVGMVHFMVPFAVLPIASSLRQIDRRLTMASRGLGARPTTIFLHIVLPLSRPGIVGAATIVFVFSLGFFITPAILGGGRTVMVAEYIYLQIFQTTNWGFGAALSLLLLLIVGLLVGLLVKAARLNRLIGR